MKIILDNIIYSHVNQGGVSNYWFELSKFLIEKRSDDLFFYEEKNAKDNFHRKQLNMQNNELIKGQSSFDSSIKKRLSKVKISIEDFFLFHSSYYRPVSESKNFVEVTTVHDFTHNYYSSFLKKILHNKLKYSCIKRSKGIICISESTYSDLKKFCPTSKNQKVAIIHNGVSDEYHLIDKSNNSLANEFIDSFNLQKPYILFVGGRANYKNFNFVAKLLKEEKEFNLVIIGGALNPNEIKLFDQESLKRIKIISNIENSELNIFYNYAHALIYPSSYEGFGIPIIEAMRAGCPVLALRNSSIIEVSGNAAILENDLNLSSFKKGLEDLKNDNFRNDIINKGFEQSLKFSWDKCCNQTYEFYKEIYND
jgi:mannosyltransferase